MGHVHVVTFIKETGNNVPVGQIAVPDFRVGKPVFFPQFLWKKESFHTSHRTPPWEDEGVRACR